MRLLLDTQQFIWWSQQSARLSPHVKQTISDPETVVSLSVASVWEIQIKSQPGKLRLHRPLDELLIKQQAENDLLLLPIDMPHILALQHLLPHHRDPFDRIIIAQAIVDGLTLASADSVFAAYPAHLLA